MISSLTINVSTELIVNLPNYLYFNDKEILSVRVNAPIDDEQLSIKKLTTDINHKKKEGNDIFNIKIEKGYIYNLELTGSTINLKSQKSGTKIISSINTKGELDSSKIKKISKLLSLNINFLNSINGKINLKTNINFDLSKSLKVNNLIYSIDGDIPYLELLTNDTSFLKRVFTRF